MRLTHYTYPAFRTQPAYGFRSPWSGLENEIDRLFSTALTDFGTTSTEFPVDVYEDKDNTFVRAELPGLSRDDINVEMAEGHLTISASRKTTGANGEAEEAFSFSRAVEIDDQIDTANVTAEFENGVLTVTLPKREEAKPKKITVAVK